MVVIINAQWTVYAIQEEFNRAFPYLKLDFFKRSYTSGSNLLRKMVSPRETIAENSVLESAEDLRITPGMTVAKLGECFAENYGLNVRVSRKTGKLWLETSNTGDWTLCLQNREGERITHILSGLNDADEQV